MGLEANLNEVLGLSYGYGKGIYGYGNHMVCKRLWQMVLNLPWPKGWVNARFSARLRVYLFMGLSLFKLS